MTAAALPAPENNSGNGTKRSQRRASYRRPQKQIPIPTVDQILQMLVQLTSAVTIGMMSTKEANVINRNLRTILDVQMKREGRDAGGPSHEALVELCRRDPRTLNILEPFLTDDVLESLAKGVTEGPDGSV